MNQPPSYSSTTTTTPTTTITRTDRPWLRNRGRRDEDGTRKTGSGRMGQRRREDGISPPILLLLCCFSAASLLLRRRHRSPPPVSIAAIVTACNRAPGVGETARPRAVRTATPKGTRLLLRIRNGRAEAFGARRRNTISP